MPCIEEELKCCLFKENMIVMLKIFKRQTKTQQKSTVFTIHNSQVMDTAKMPHY
jgi:AAA15 family ATPase/GTPase